MSEENKGVVIPGEAESHIAAPTIQEAYEEKARGLGWRPETEWKGDRADWRPAKEFLDRQPLFDKIHSLKNELYHQKKSFETDLETIKSYVKNMSETEYKKALTDVKTQRRLAVADGNVEAVDVYDAQIEQLQASKLEIKEAPKPAGPPPEFTEWAEKNQWYAKDADMRADADGLGQAYVARNQGKVSVQQTLDYVRGRMEKMYPEKFNSTPQTQAVSEVESGGVSRGEPTRSNSKLKESDLNEQERHVMNTMVKRGVLTKSEYIKQLGEAKARG